MLYQGQIQRGYGEGEARARASSIELIHNFIFIGLKVSFLGKVWINLINSGYRIYAKYIQHLLLPYTSLQEVHFTTCECV